MATGSLVSRSNTNSGRRFSPYNLDGLHYPGCDDECKYQIEKKIGHGTFGAVYKAHCKQTGKVVAMKKVLMDNEREGFPITAVREIKILQQLDDDNVVKLIEICRSKESRDNQWRSNIYLVFEFCHHDLAGLLSNPTLTFKLGEIKEMMKQLMSGLEYIHFNKILHRDIKPANILITKQGVLKLADFGLARAYSDPEETGQANCYTTCVVTRWYRPPELFLGERNYNSAIDQWGAGCIMAEMWTRSPILQGTTEQNQLNFIIQLCGSITPEVWPGVEKLKLYNKIVLPKSKTNRRRVTERLQRFVEDPCALDLLDNLLALDPAKRISAKMALDHQFFWTGQEPEKLTQLMSRCTMSNFELMAHRHQQPRPNNQRPQPRKPPNGDQHFERTY